MSTLSTTTVSPVSPKTRGILKSAVVAVGSPLALMWVVRFVDWVLTGRDLVQQGIRPRSLSGLDGVFFAPFLHTSWSHLVSNTVPFVVLGAVLAVERAARFGSVFLLTAVGSGLGTWIIAPSNTVHAGASGVVFGLLGYLLVRGVFDRKAKSIAIGVAVLLFYGGLVWGVLPTNPRVSWQGHLFGFISGIVVAYFHGVSSRRARRGALTT